MLALSVRAVGGWAGSRSTPSSWPPRARRPCWSARAARARPRCCACIAGLERPGRGPDRARRTRPGPTPRSASRVPARRRARRRTSRRTTRSSPTSRSHENVAFGLRALGTRAARGAPRARSRCSSASAIGASGPAAPSPSSPAGSSSASRSRARSCSSPDVLLLDEPLSALDLAHAPGRARRAAPAARGAPLRTLYVTHSPAEAMVFGERHRRCSRRAGSASRAPATTCCAIRARRYVAELVGTNLLYGTVGRRAGGTEIRTGDGRDHGGVGRRPRATCSRR